MTGDLDRAKELLARMDAAYPEEELTLHAHILMGEDVDLFKHEGSEDDKFLAEKEIPTEYKLKPATPNPFNPVTTISYDLPENSHVRLVIYDILGREIRKLVDGFKEKGTHSAHFDGSNLSSGVYIVLFEAGDYTSTSKLMLVK